MIWTIQRFIRLAGLKRMRTSKLYFFSCRIFAQRFYTLSRRWVLSVDDRPDTRTGRTKVLYYLIFKLFRNTFTFNYTRKKSYSVVSFWEVI